jgi:putative heme-binding domain-containing protein
VNFVNAPDGTLTVLDMYRETIEHPWSIPDDIRAQLNLRSGSDRGRIYRLTPPGFHRRPTPRLSLASTAELVSLLEHPNGWHRETAHRLLNERQDRAAVPSLKQLIRCGKDARGRLRALYACDGCGSLDQDSLLAALADASPWVREHAVILAEPLLARSPALQAAVARLADDPSVRVRFQVAFTLGEVGGDIALGGLVAIARRDGGDPWVRTAVLSSAMVDPCGLFERLWQDRSFAASPNGIALLRPFALVVGVRNRPGEAARILTVVSAEANADTEVSRAVMIGLSDGLVRAGRRLSELKAEVSLASAAWLDRLLVGAERMAADSSQILDRRTEAAQILEHTTYDRAMAILPGLLVPREPSEIQAAAVRSIGGFDRPEVAGILLAPWKGYSPALRAQIVGLLLGRRGWNGPLLDAVRTGLVPPGEIPPNRRELLLKDRDPAIRERATAVLGGLAPAPRAAAIEAYKRAIDRAGDSERGRTIFERECMACHKLGDRGHSVGPNLASMRRKTPEEILLSILDPNREVSPEFVEYLIALDDGRVVTGIVASETPGGLAVRGRESAEQTILRRNIAQIAGTGKSLMPEGLEKNITPPEMTDLITFLLKLQD